MTHDAGEPQGPRIWRPPTSRDGRQPTTRDRAAATSRDGRPATARDASVPTSDDDCWDSASPSGSATAIRLPDYLDRDYDVVDELPSGGEADVAVVRHRGDGSMKVVKVYRGGIDLPQSLVDKLANADPAHVLPVQRRLYDKWRTPRWIEVMDYLPTGSLDALLQAMPGGAPYLANDILVELTDALDYVHQSLDLVHRDIKPANILIRSLNPLDLVLSDLGIAAELADTRRSLRQTTGGLKGTLVYQAPETLNMSNAKAPRDWWALGMTLCEVLAGQHPFKDGRGNTLHDQNAIRDAITMGKIDLSMITDERWNLLCRGLLVHQPDDRWGATQIRAWLEGKSPAVSANRIDSSQSGHQTGAFTFAGQAFTDPRALATHMLSHWDEAAALFTAKDGCDGLFMWIRHDVQDASIPANLFVPVGGDRSLADARIVEFASRYRRGEELIFRGTRITAGDLAKRFLRRAESWKNDSLLAALTPDVTAALVEARLNLDAGPHQQSAEYYALHRLSRYAGEVDRSIQEARAEIISAVSVPIGDTDVGAEVRDALPLRSTRAQATARAALLSPECLAHIRSQFDGLGRRRRWFAELCASASRGSRHSSGGSPAAADADGTEIARKSLAVNITDLVGFYEHARAKAEAAAEQRRLAEEVAAAQARRQQIREGKRGPLWVAALAAVVSIVGLIAHNWAANKILPVGGFPQTWVYAVLHWPSAQLQGIALIIAAAASIGMIIYVALEDGTGELDTPARAVAGYSAICILPLVISLALALALVALVVGVIIFVVLARL